MKNLKVLEIAKKEIGYKETPKGSNLTKYGKWFGLDGKPWCGMFVSWVYSQAGIPLGNIGFTKGFAGCQTAVKHYKATGEITTKPQPGDIVFYDWQKDGKHDHTGIFVREINATTFEAYEGNTANGNDSNGGQVMQRFRKYSVAIFVHPKVLD
jgi:cell wall-associated NlpC family hydrolase